jgi:hypothetical protein
MSSPVDEREFRSIIRIKEGDDWRAAFVIDGRGYTDSEAVRTARRDALRELQRRGIPAEFETSSVGPQEPPLPLPSWEEFREGLAGS